ncbi:pseudouridine synthase [Shinella zoogloeoides]|uniref:Pseudouridine synthase n=1 Tax=Shinella zoogloeoides TaxID=352475 RepID=A0A6N8TFM2_SHIZO|nr:pseudouridine synthase [Shinella zoogloeoides]MXN99987.1 pseudouridine synthase [Shinella zoogloeoides]UEX82329.1 pseudouridine synthase [Shinella zoogloeoides]
MTFKDKPKRPGGKPSGRDTKPRGAASAAAGKKSFAGGKPEGKKPGGKPFAGKSAPRDDRPARAAKPAPAEAASAELAPERISKLLARAGVASRRDIERMIMEGRISVNGKVLETPVVNATFADRIEVDGMPVRGIERTRLWLYHKPAGLVTTNADPEGRPTVFDNLPEDLPRVMSIGRLDINTEGLLLLTNDGGLARMLELPTTGWLRRYRVRAHGKIEQADLDKLKEGIAVDGVLYGAIDATLDKTQGSNVWLTLGLREGKNREVKNVLGALGLDVNRLIRISYGPFQLGELPEGHAQEIRGRTLRDQLGPRLIEESKANFDAPLFDHVADEDEKPAKKARSEAPGWGDKPAERREKPGDRRENARARLDTKRDDRFGDKPRGGPRDRDRDDDRFDSKPKREPATRARKSNVWMAPGARPVAEKKAEDAEGVKREPRERPEGAPKSKRYGRTADGALTRSAKKFDPDRKGAARGRPGDDRADKPRILKTRDEDGEWIRASEPEARDEGRGGFGRNRSGAGDDRAPRGFGDRPPRGDRSFGDRKPRSEGDRSFGDRKPRSEGDRSFGDRPPRGDRPFGDRKPRAEGERSFGDRPARGDRPFGGRKPRAEGERSFGDRPPRRDGGKPFGGKPGGKSFGGKPGGRPGGKPGGGRPAGGSRPRGKGK